MALSWKITIEIDDKIDVLVVLIVGPVYGYLFNICKGFLI